MDEKDELEIDEDLFDEETEVEENEDNIKEIDEEESDNSENINDEETEVEENGKNDRQSLINALNRERRLRKEAEKKAKTSKVIEKSDYDNLVEAGVDKEIAKAIADMGSKNKAEIADVKFENTILKLSKNENFSDIEDYQEEIKPLVDKGLTVEQAYYAVTGEIKKEKSRTTKAEMQREAEAIVLNNLGKNQNSAINTQGTAPKSSVTNKVKYTALEAKIARASGMTPEEYVEYKEMSDIDDYEKFEKNKNRKRSD